MPSSLLDLKDLHSLFSYQKYQEIFTSEEKKHLSSLLPDSHSPEKILKWLFSAEQPNPMDEFLKKLHAGQFSHTKQQQIKLQKQLYNHSILEHFENLYEELKEKLEDTTTQKNYLYKRKNSQFLEDLFTEESDRDKQSVSALSLENSFSELSQGYSTPISINDDPIIASFSKKNHEMNLTLQENRIMEARKTMFEGSKNKRTPVPETDSIQSQKIIANGGNKANVTVGGVNGKPTNATTTPTIGSNGKKATKPVTSKEWIDNYRSQEAERYSNPLRPYTYLCQDGSKGIVAPVSKKISFASATKPRDHFLLKTERPPYITILCLVRDAASRLPNGFGTRADICELLKESQYINEHVPDDKLSNIVSGALDRLHYEDDACVKYDPEKKLWIYLHRGRTENFPAWMEQNDSRSSKKKEYNQKYKNRKRIRIEDIKPMHK